jgi:hypothetical protein
VGAVEKHVETHLVRVALEAGGEVGQILAVRAVVERH